MKVKDATILAAICAVSTVLVLPASGTADTPAVTAPEIPTTFVGAPRAGDLNAGQFTLDFDGSGTFLGIGRLPDPAQKIDVTMPREVPQETVNASGRSPEEEAITDREIAALRQQLRDCRSLKPGAVAAR